MSDQVDGGRRAVVDGPSAGRDSGDMPDIATMLREHMDRSGDSARELARKTGDVVDHQTISKLLAGATRQWPKRPETIEALARVMGVDVATVVLAFARTLGLPVRRGGPKVAALLPADADQLTDEQAAAVAEIVRVMTPQQVTGEDQTRGGGGDDSARAAAPIATLRWSPDGRHVLPPEDVAAYTDPAEATSGQPHDETVDNDSDTHT